MIIRAILLLLVVAFVMKVHDGASVMRTNIKAEQECLERANGQSDLDNCFAMTKLNMEKE